MRPPSDYAPPDAPIRRQPVIDLPDDFGTDQARKGDLFVTGLAAVVLLIVVAIAAYAIGAFAP